MKVVLRKASVGTKKGKFQLSNNRIWLKRPKYRPKTSHQLPELRRGRISGHLDSLHMNNFGLILRSVVWFLFPLPWLLSFAMEHGGDWTAWVAYIAIVALILAAVVSGWVAIRGDR